MRIHHLLVATALTLVLAMGTVAARAAEGVESLLRFLPPTSNTLAVVRVGKVLESPRAKREGWKAETVKFLAGADTVPAWVDTLVLGAQFHPGDPENWSASVLYCPSGVSVAEMAKSESRPLQQLGGVAAMHTHRDAYFLQLKPDVLGVITPALRQPAARWARQATAATEPQLSEFLTIVAATPAHIVMAIDMQDMLDPQLIRQRLEATESLKGKTQAIGKLEKLFASLKGVAFYAEIKDETDARIDMVFADTVPAEAERLKGLVLEMLSDQRMMLEDFRDSKASVNGEVFSMETKLSDGGLRRIMSLILSPYPVSAKSSGGVAPAAEEPPAETAADQIKRQNRQYFGMVQRTLRDLQTSTSWVQDYGEVAGWFERYAQKLDNLPRAGIDEELVNYAGELASKLRALAGTTRGMVVDVNAAQSTLTYRTDVNYAPYGGWGWGWGWGGGWGPHWSVTSNLEQVRTEQAKAISKSSKKSEEIRRQILDQDAAIRKRMEDKYGADFTKGAF